MGTFTVISVGTKVIPKDQLADHCLVMCEVLLGWILQLFCWSYPETGDLFPVVHSPIGQCSSMHHE